MLTLHEIRVHRQGRCVLDIPRLDIDTRSFTVILGHNGSGKSTMMGAMARQLRPDHGRLSLEGKPYSAMSSREFARRVAFLPQRLPDAAGLSVHELVRLGRYPWRGLLGAWHPEDENRVVQALRDTDVQAHSHRAIDELSGGERQRAWTAMLLAQQSPLLLLDEPTAALDVSHQYDLMRLLHRLNRSAARGVVVILHDVNLAARFADRIIALRQGRVHFDGPPSNLMNTARLSALYETEMLVMPHPVGGAPVALVA